MGEPRTVTLDGRGGKLEVATVAILFFSPISILVGWLFACVLLWISPFWTRTDKLVGTLAPLLGVLLAVGVWMLAASAESSAMVAALIGWVLGPICTALYLAFRFRDRKRALAIT